MNRLLDKLNFKGQHRIAVLNTESDITFAPFKDLKDVIVDTTIDQRYPYDFIIIFVSKVSEVEYFAPVVLHNLVADGILWFCYPKKTSRNFTSEIDRDHGWKALNDLDFFGIRMVALDNDWSAMRFRNKKYIKSKSARFSK